MPVSMQHLIVVAHQATVGEVSGVDSLLAKWKDGLFYKVIKIKEYDEKKKRCLCVFEDKSEEWMSNKDMQIQLNLDLLEDEQILCCICDSGDSNEPNEIVICDICQQGYHILCHEPGIDRDKVKLEDDCVEWNCITCEELWRTGKSSTEENKEQEKPKSKVKAGKRLSKTSSSSARKPPKKKAKLSTTPKTKVKLDNNNHNNNNNNNNNKTILQTSALVEAVE